MPKVNHEILKAVQDAFEIYKTEVRATSLKVNTKNTYINRAQNFVRWLDDDFEPGSGLKN